MILECQSSTYEGQNISNMKVAIEPNKLKEDWNMKKFNHFYQVVSLKKPLPDWETPTSLCIMVV